MKKLAVLLILATTLVITSPASAEIIGSISVGDASCLAVKGDIVYCGTRVLGNPEGNLKIIDTSDKEHPSVVTTRTVGDLSIYDMAITPDQRYLVTIGHYDDNDRPYCLEKWSIDDPLSPTLVRRVIGISRDGSYSVCIDETGATAFVTSRSSSESYGEDAKLDLKRVDLNGEANSIFNKVGVQVSNYDCVYDSQSSGQYVYVVASNAKNGLNFQIRNQDNLGFVGGLDIGTTAAYCVANDTTVGITAIGTNGGGVTDDVLITDTFKPTQPVLIGGIKLGSRISFMRLNWPNLYCFGRKGWFTEYDSIVKLISLANHSDPAVIEEIDIGSNIKAVEVTKEAGISTAYVATAAKITTQGAKVSPNGTGSNDGSLVILRPTSKASVNSWEMYY